MINLEEGLVSCGRVTCGLQAGYITAIGSTTYRVRWLDGAETEQLRPDLKDEDQIEEAAQ